MKINDIIVHLMIIENFAKDIHYTCHGEGAYGKHLLADVVSDEISGFIDDLKEIAILGQHELPLQSKEYLGMAHEKALEVASTDVENLERLSDFITTLRDGLKNVGAKTRGVDSLLDRIGEHLDKSVGLIFLQTRKASVNESEVKVDHEASTQNPVDREEAKEVIPDPEETKKIILDYEAKNVLVAEEKETVVDRLYNKIIKDGDL